MKPSRVISSVLILAIAAIFMAPASSSAQTIYKKDAGYFTPLFKSLFIKGGSFESAVLIGPAVGYRFNKNFDLAIHPEFLTNSYPLAGGERKATLLNLGVILGNTRHLSKSFMLRSKASLYQSVNFHTESYGSISKPSLSSALGSSAIYATLPLSSSIRLLPNAGGFLGYGSYDPVYSEAELTQAFDGFAVGPQFGLDAVLELNDDIYFSIRPMYRIWYNTTHDYTDKEFTLEVQLNF